MPYFLEIQLIFILAHIYPRNEMRQPFRIQGLTPSPRATKRPSQHSLPLPLLLYTILSIPSDTE